MKISQFLATILLTGSASTTVYADSTIVLNPSNNHWYQRFDTSMDWYEAKAFCEKRGGYLATITTQAENDFVWNYIASQSPNTGGIWLGATNNKTKTTTGAFQWVTGEAWSYSNWNLGEPNNSQILAGEGEHYLEFFPIINPARLGSWNDIGSYNQGTLWNRYQDNQPYNYRPVSTLCEWGGNIGSWNF
jgi:hypothetical protein